MTAWRSWTAATGGIARGAVYLDRIDRAEPAEHGQIVPRPAAYLQDAGLFGKGDLARDQVAEYLAPRAIPPMAAVQLRHAVINAAFHQLSSIRRTPSGG